MSNLSLFNYDNEPFMLDNSGLQTWNQCQRKYELSCLHHRRAPDERIATALGTAVHDVAKPHFLGRDISKAFKEHSQKFADGIFNIDERQNTLAKFNTAIQQLLEHYPVIQKQGLNAVLDLQLQTRWIVRYPEKPFIQPLASPSSDKQYAITGRIDCIVEDGNQQMWILELKTSSKANNSIWRNSWHMATQPLTYTYVAQRQLHKLVAGVIIIPIQMNKYDAIMTPEIVIRPSAKALQDWEQHTISLLESIKLATHYNHFIPTGQYAGNCSNIALGRCDFFNYCKLNQPDGWLEDNTKEHKWNPLAEEEEKNYA